MSTHILFRESHHLSSTHLQPRSNPTMLNRMRKSFSRKNSHPTSNSSAQQISKAGSRQSTLLSPSTSNPFTTGSPQTRRPSGRSNMANTPSEPPPAYTPAPSSQPSSLQPEADNPYSFLKSFDTIFLIDDSGSMAGRSWREVSEALKLITPICASHDSDGIDLFFLNHPDSSIYKNVTSASTVVEIFQTVRPCGGTPTGQKLNKILKPYLQKYAQSPEGTKPVNIIVITDGAPTDDVESPIIAAAKKLDKLEAPAWQVGIQFFQVGKEEGARQHLKMLDDELKDISGDPDLRDMVDTVEYKGDDGGDLSAAGILKCVLGAVNRKLDRGSRELHRH